MTESSQTLLRYHGRSMWPCFQEGDLLACQPVAPAQVRVGDCIAYRSRDGQQVVHRVVARQKGWRTRGDALPACDENVVAADQLLGRVIHRHRFGQVSSVAGGIPGRIAGRFYHYAGRIDPSRPSRGGRLARGLRALAAPLLRSCRRHGSAQRLMRGEQEDLWLWKCGKVYVGQKHPQSGEWRLVWPWCLVVDLNRRGTAG